MTEMFLKDKNVFQNDVQDVKIMFQICYQMPTCGSTFPQHLGPMTWKNINLDMVGKVPGAVLVRVRTQMPDIARKNPRLKQGASLDGGKRLIQ